MSKIKVVGVAGNPEFIHFKTMAQTERKKTVEIQELFESEYDQQMKPLKKNQTLRLQFKKLQPLSKFDQFYSLDDSFISKQNKRPLVVFRNGTPTVHPSRHIKFSQSVINESLKSQLQCFNLRQSAYAFMELEIGQQTCQVIFELYQDYAPKACENFFKFCEGVKINNQHYTYQNSSFSRYQPNGYLQGGQFNTKISIFGNYFEDESYAIKHDCEGILGLANDGFQHTNTSQFYITLAPFPWFNKKRVAFGKIIKGFKDLQKLLKLVDVNEKQLNIKIINCGKYDQNKQIKMKIEKFTDEFSCVIPQKTKSFRQFVEQEQEKHKEASGELTTLLNTLSDIFIQLNGLVYKYKSQQKIIDLISKELEKYQCCSLLYILDTQKLIHFKNVNSKYLVALRAIDGTDSHRGSAFLILRKQTTIFRQISSHDFKQTAENAIAVGYCVHGITTQLVLGIGYNLTLFTLNQNEFKLTKQEYLQYYIKRLQVPHVETFYCSDVEQNDLIKQIINSLPQPQHSEYTDSIFTSLHRAVLKGGLIMYKEVSIFEAIICSFVISRAWGWSFCTGTTTYNQIRIQGLEQKTDLYLGQQQWIQKIEHRYLSIH